MATESSMVKVCIIGSGKTNETDMEFFNILRNRIKSLRIKKVPTVDESDIVLVFCPVVSSAGTDIEAALKRFDESTDSKLNVLVVLHHTFDPEKTVLDSRRCVNREDILTVDCLFYEDTGLLKCQKNHVAMDKVVNWLIKKGKEKGFKVCLPTSPAKFFKQRTGMSSKSGQKDDESQHRQQPQTTAENETLQKGKRHNASSDNLQSSSSCEVKICLCSAGATRGAEFYFIDDVFRLRQTLVMVATEQESDVVLYFRPVVSQTDCDAALQECSKITEKPLVVILLHHTNDPDTALVIRAQYRSDMIVVDCLFYGGVGLTQCRRNDAAVSAVSKWLSNKGEVKSKAEGNRKQGTQGSENAELDEKCKRLEDTEKLLTERDTQIKEKSKETALEEKDRLLNTNVKLLQTSREVEDKQREIKEKNKLMSEKERQLENTVKELNTSKHQLETLRNELQKMKMKLDEQNIKFTHQEKILQEHKQQQQQYDQEVKDLHCEVERLKNESSKHLAELNENSKRLEDTERLLTERDTLIKDLEKSKETALEKKDRLNTNDKLLQTSREVEDKQREIEEKNKLMSEKERQLENTVKDLDTSKHQLETLRNRLQDKSSKLQQLLEENKLLKSSVSGEAAPVLVPGSELRLVLLGCSGSEKSAAVNMILGREEKNQTDTSTETQQSESRQGEVDGKQVTVVETPDWFCSGLSLEEVRQDVGRCVHLSAPGPHAFLLVIPVQQSAGVEREMLEKMEEIFGERCWMNTMILFTATDEEQRMNIKAFVQSGNPGVQRLVQKCGNQFHCLNIHQHSSSANGSQVSELLEKIEKMVETQRDSTAVRFTWK